MDHNISLSATPKSRPKHKASEPRGAPLNSAPSPAKFITSGHHLEYSAAPKSRPKNNLCEPREAPLDSAPTTSSSDASTSTTRTKTPVQTTEGRLQTPAIANNRAEGPATPKPRYGLRRRCVSAKRVKQD
ncbi:hypothetical protein V5799_029900 [Amblyomma americanum]|uniref:Uncharacterized protein n=1 Tax=Amblyomma americanum TaxID=6943 RepID=A0AAQ4EPZ7_AMBAM